MLAETIAVGSEMLTPYRQDTNSLFITERLNEIGVKVAFKTTVGDRMEHLVSAVRTAAQRVDIVVIMGGLGPTQDDLTRQAVAEAMGIHIRRNADIVAELYKRFAARRMSMTENNAQQADVLEGAHVVPNANGTAPAQWLDTVFGGHRKILMLLPGPPLELKPIFENECMPRLREALPQRFIAMRTLKAAMIGESACDARIAPIYKHYPDIETTILANGGDIQLNLICEKPALEIAQARVDELAGRIEEELDDLIYSTQGESLEEIVLLYLGMKGATLAVAESCTGGLVAERITRIPGSSRAFLGGAVVYSNELKATFAGVDATLIAQYGAVSSQVAKAMADGIRKKAGASTGLAVTGIAGPGGGTEEKPVGLVYIAVAHGKEIEVVEKNFAAFSTQNTRERVRMLSAQAGLDLVRRRLMGNGSS
ncbi:MAG TPA: competence/damage-inducible protein A [Acidobacteriaceae bacterium]